MGVPEITVQVAFASNPADASYTWTTIHDGAAPDAGKVRSLSYQRGRQNELNRVEAGTASLLLADPDSDFDPDNTAGAYTPNVKPMKPVRARATIGGTTYPLFLGYAERWPRTLRVRDAYTERSLETVDGFALLALASLQGQVYAQELSGTRVGNVLDDVASWPAALRDLDAGQATVAALTFAADDDTKALTHLQAVEESENGLLFVDAQGRVAFLERHALIASPFTTSQATFRDAAGGGGHPYADAVPSYDVDLVTNDWFGTRTGGTTQTATDTPSQTSYGRRSKEITSLVTTDAEVLSQVQWKLRQFKDPLFRLESITVMPGRSTAAWEAVLGLDLGERITVVETPPGFTTVQTNDYLIQSLHVEIPAGPVEQARFTFGLWPADVNTWLILDDANVGKLDTGALAY